MNAFFCGKTSREIYSNPPHNRQETYNNVILHQQNNKRDVRVSETFRNKILE